MLHNPHRLPLLINIGLLVAQATVHSKLHVKFPIIGDNPDDNPHYFLIQELWESALSLLSDLALMDHKNNFSPDAFTSPLLIEYGLWQEYWVLRGRYDPEPEDCERF
ncbi:hypothetical protein HX866_03565 [Pseudomonas gingeri]|uniref:hypothetical protein n=1 Tax=Pseudomonas gingeri TaxID=117681 RepID=UPI0015A29DC8|nr:hypothetical protein [Pseudomonas gingeri]NWA23961.1 hypothetical protein [Pseudomonas gingeri]